MSFDICLRPAELGDGVQLVDQCPGTRFIVDHCGNADPLVVSGAREADPGDGYAHQREQWMQDMQELGQRDNTFCKISGIVARVPSEWTPQDLAPTIDHCLDAFGPDRVIFGGDWPVCTLGATYREWAGALREVISSRSEADQRKLLHDNAVEIFGLD
jgi:L-fuconolactonase